MYLNLVFCAYGHFLTFCLVQDSCYTSEDDKKNTCLHWLNTICRIFFHSMFVCLVGLCYYAKSCETDLYPPIFTAVGVFIFTQQVFDLGLHLLGYLIDLDSMPHTHIDKLRFNKKLFLSQMKALLVANILFGTLSILVMAMGRKFINADDNQVEKYLICVDGNRW